MTTTKYFPGLGANGELIPIVTPRAPASTATPPAPEVVENAGEPVGLPQGTPIPPTDPAPASTVPVVRGEPGAVVLLRGEPVGRVDDGGTLRLADASTAKDAGHLIRDGLLTQIVDGNLVPPG